MENTNKDEIGFSVTDIENRVYTLLKEPIGQGGQGAVYKVQNDLDIAVKITNANSDDAIKKISQKLFELRRLPIPYELNISRPLAILKSHAGYVMSFMNGMESFDKFLKLHQKIEDGEIPSWLKQKDGSPVEQAEVWANYCKTGGIRERFYALYKISELLAQLHTRGLVYGDISPANLMYKKSGKKISAGLIDADNINYGGDASTFYTPGYGAPEIVTGKSHATIFSDSYAFAVAAFYIITMMHPFKGEKVIGTNDEDDWAKTVTTQQNADTDFKDDGSLPWIFDADDDSNTYGNEGQVRILFLNDELMNLFDNTFSKGHTNPVLRTPLNHWAKAFAGAADSTIKCNSCGMSYFYDYEEDGKHCCPYCQSPRGKILVAKSKHNFAGGAETEKTETVHIFVHELDCEEFFLPKRCFEPFNSQNGDDAVIGIKQNGEFIEFRSLLENENVYFSTDGKKFELLAGKQIFRLDTKNLSLKFYCKVSMPYLVNLNFTEDDE